MEVHKNSLHYKTFYKINNLYRVLLALVNAHSELIIQKCIFIKKSQDMFSYVCSMLALQ